MCKMADRNEGIMTRDISEIGRDIVAWCALKGVQNWLSGFAILVAIALGIFTIYASNQGKDCLDKTINGWKYLSFAILIPVSQFLSWLCGFASKGQINQVMIENQNLRNRLSRVELIEQNMESIFGVWLNLIIGEVKMDGECRASFYVWDDKDSVGNEFVYLARESSDPMLKRKGRDHFPRQIQHPRHSR